MPARSAFSQVHWDAAALFGSTLAKAEPKSDAVFAPLLRTRAELAILPLFRAGASFEFSSAQDQQRTQFATPGITLTAFSPWVVPHWRMWLTSGVGYTWMMGGRDDAAISVPVSLGVSHHVQKPWSAVVELGGRFGDGATPVVLVGLAYER